MLQNLRVSQQETPRPPLTLLTFWPLTVDLSRFSWFFFPAPVRFHVFGCFKNTRKLGLSEYLFSAPATHAVFLVARGKKHLGVLNVPLVVGSTVNEPMEVGGLEWLQEPFQPRSSGSSGLCFFFGSGENWEDLSSLERQKEFKVTWFWTSNFNPENGPYPPNKKSTRWTFGDFVCILLSLELSVIFSNMKRHVFFGSVLEVDHGKTTPPRPRRDSWILLNVL